MIHRKNISTINNPLFPFCWELYLAAFPENERRGLDYHTETMNRELFHCDVVLDSDEPIGILFWWDLSDFIFVEHLATTPAVRGKGYGNQILNELIASSNRPILLEVEHPEDELSRRRIGFYERMGFILNHHPYRHPSYQQIEGEYVDLLVMTHPNPISASELQHFITNEFPVIHFRSFGDRVTVGG
ncbi:MAG: GNAT family N-acetyltransferase [Rikenellaceae bacterium]